MHVRTRLLLLTSGLILTLAACGGVQEDVSAQAAQLESKSNCLATASNPCAGLSRTDCGNAKCGKGAYDYCAFSNGMCRSTCATVVEPVPTDPVPVPTDPTQVGAQDELISKSSCLATASNPCAGLSRTDCGNVKCGSGAYDYCIFSNGMCRNPCGTATEEPVPKEPVPTEPVPTGPVIIAP